MTLVAFQPQIGQIVSVMSPIPTTVDYIAHHAALHPDDIAVISNDQAITYAQFHRDLSRFIRTVGFFKLGIGDSVTIEWTTLYPHWLLLLAFEARGVATASYASHEMPGCMPLLTSANLVINTAETPPPGVNRHHQITDEWVNNVLAQENDITVPSVVLPTDRPLRIVQSSGTTREANRMLRTAEVHDYRVWQYQQKEGYTRRSRYLLTHSFSVHAVYGRATACLRAGGTCVYASPNIMPAIFNHAITHMAILPVWLAKVLDALPPNQPKPPGLTVSTFGGTLSAEMRHRTLEIFATDLIESYGTNEVGTICSFGEDGSGIVFPGVIVETVDDDDRPVTAQPGRIRIKSPGAVAGYIDAPEMSAKMFRDGWFYPGDIGIMTDRRSLKLLGRADNLINIGGLKTSPEELEEQLRRAADIEDICVTELAAEDGERQVWIILQLQDSSTFKDVVEAIKPKIPTTLERVSIVEIGEIPRAANGKILRHDVDQLILGAQSQS